MTAPSDLERFFSFMRAFELAFRAAGARVDAGTLVVPPFGVPGRPAFETLLGAPGFLRLTLAL